MSHGPCRAKPRWSVGGQTPMLPLLIAGLSGSSGLVWDIPPLSPSGPSLGSVPNLSVEWWNPHSSRLSMLCPSEVRAVLQFGLVWAWPPLTIVFSAWTVPLGYTFPAYVAGPPADVSTR